jgi:enamine deaminase RidA (YjgF/YER057c/UK114 family)
VSKHRLVNPASGYAQAVVAAPGRTVYIAGQTGVGPTLVEQFGAALDNVVAALAAAGSQPEDVVSMQIFATDVAAYRASTRELGEVYRGRFGRHYPAMALLGVSELVDPAALVEIVAVAVVAEER